MEPFFLQDNPCLYKSGFSETNGYSYRSIVHQDFTDIYGLFYRKKSGKSVRFVTRKLLNYLDEFGLMIWFLDDGGITEDKEIRFATNAYSLSEQRTMQKWFWQKIGIEVKIAFNKNNNSYFLRINVSNSKKLMKLFCPLISKLPKCLMYKFRFHFNLNDYTLNSYSLKGKTS